MRQRSACQTARQAAFGEMNFEKRTMLSGEFAERIQRLDHARAMRPAASRAARQRHDRHASACQRIQADLAVCFRQPLRGVVNIVSGDIFDMRADRQPVLRKADAAIAQIAPNLFMLDAIKAEFFKLCVE